MSKRIDLYAKLDQPGVILLRPKRGPSQKNTSSTKAETLQPTTPVYYSLIAILPCCGFTTANSEGCAVDDAHGSDPHKPTFAQYGITLPSPKNWKFHDRRLGRHLFIARPFHQFETLILEPG